MKRTDEILQQITCNEMRELTDLRAKQAMRQTAVGFGEWLIKSDYQKTGKDYWMGKGGLSDLKTTEQLFEIFDNQKEETK